MKLYWTDPTGMGIQVEGNFDSDGDYYTCECVLRAGTPPLVLTLPSPLFAHAPRRHVEQRARAGWRRQLRSVRLR